MNIDTHKWGVMESMTVDEIGEAWQKLKLMHETCANTVRSILQRNQLLNLIDEDNLLEYFEGAELAEITDSLNNKKWAEMWMTKFKTEAIRRDSLSNLVKTMMAR